ncbi:crotonase/enoyl-CoA hydratase family protein [Gordonia pseudamarae]|uniref:Crotonase/enoyl-CoA hydratase family protein n=1 Tax=Gordonia pseudamarae TaxID=2831662 RepID=A0ABX6IM12_9ACTN|nr:MULTISPECIES: crotonase/enoyl-CoA hydratase family protein [Gordonia]MBD0024476.1 crotonase/enoyl-CoA hydratase family protein [Gordonia sp. (in: high G+C Gram-positive bacteria)]QHN27895.1 crotonase/enoyl-CoA hydratase family protein [Gordonia pseudamarae]QHN36752.1 crotonase/enoyl-CoA hydratase family protein [Gordonia pseudamarae]
MTEIEPADNGPVLYRVHDHIAVITFNRPEAMNSVNSALSAAAGAALERADADPAVRAVVLTGAGKAFCAGADLKELGAGRRIDDPDHREWDFAGIVRHWISTPVIAAVNGFALGGGTEIVLTADLAVIDETATMGLPEVRRGIVAAAGGLLRIHRQVPQKIAAEIALTGEPISAARAYELGLVNRIAPAGTALDVALELAATIARNAPLAVAESKRVMHETALDERGWDDRSWQINKTAIRTVFASADAKEGPRAFAEKRPPQWTGR